MWPEGYTAIRKFISITGSFLVIFFFFWVKSIHKVTMHLFLFEFSGICTYTLEKNTA